jgi:RNA polymerase sigma-70 factor (ECF subfamily)
VTSRVLTEGGREGGPAVTLRGFRACESGLGSATEQGMAAGLSDPSVRLIAGCVRGDREAFARLYELHASLVYTFALRLLHDRAEAEELVQDVFVQAWRQAATYREDRGTPAAWLLMITRSRGIDKLRSRRKRVETLQLMDAVERMPDLAAGDSGPSRAETKVTLGGALLELPPAQREVLELAYFEGLTQSEIAARLGEPLGTVKTRMRGGLERLRGLLAARTAAGHA